MARSRLFATSLSLVLKSLIGSAVLTASQPLAVISAFYVGYFIAVGFWDCLWLSAQQTECYLTHPLLFLLFMSGILSLWIFGIVFSIGSADSAAL